MKSTGKETSGCEKKAIESIPSKSYCKATVKKHKGVKIIIIIKKAQSYNHRSC